MKITPTGRPPSVVRPRRADGAGARAEGFALGIGAGVERAGGVAPPAPLAALSGILAVQEVPDATGERRAVDRGHGILDELHALRVALIDGWVPEDALRRVAALVDEARPGLADPDLEAVLDDIELRAAVELAKAGRR